MLNHDPKDFMKQLSISTKRSDQIENDCIDFLNATIDIEPLEIINKIARNDNEKIYIAAFIFFAMGRESMMEQIKCTCDNAIKHMSETIN